MTACYEYWALMAQVMYLQSPSGPGSPFTKKDPDPALLTLEGMEELLEKGGGTVLAPCPPGPHTCMKAVPGPPEETELLALSQRAPWAHPRPGRQRTRCPWPGCRQVGTVDEEAPPT